MRQNGPQRRGRGRPSGRRGNNNSPNRSYDSSGPDVKIRGTASTVYEKYSALARDAIVSGDRVAAENFYQHAEHYYRVMQTMRQQRQSGDGEQADNRSRGQQNRDDRNNEDGSQSVEEKVGSAEDSNLTAMPEPLRQISAAGDGVEEIETQTSLPEQEESSSAPMNPAELAAMSESGRKVRDLQNGSGENTSPDEPAPRRQTRRRRTVPAGKSDLNETNSKESEKTDNIAKEEAK